MREQRGEHTLYDVASRLSRTGNEARRFADRNELRGLHERALAARREVGRREGGSVQAAVDRHVADGGAWHQIGKLRGAGEPRAALEDAVHEGRGPVDVAEGTAEDHARVTHRSAGFGKHALHGDGPETRGAVETAGPGRIEVRVRIRRGTARLRLRRSVVETWGSEAPLRECRAFLDAKQPARTEHGGAGDGNLEPGRLQARRADSGQIRLGEHEHRVHAAEAERVRNRGSYASRLASDVRYVHQGGRGVGVVESRGRHERAPCDDESGDGRLDGPRRPEGVSDLRLAARDGDALHLVSQRASERRRLHQVVQRRARPMGVDVVDVARAESCTRDGALDERRDQNAVGRGIRDVMRLRAKGPPGQLRDRFHAARARPVRAFEHQEARALSEARPAPRAIERAARLGVDGGEGVEAAEGQAAEAVAPADHDRVRLVREQPRRPDHDRVCAARARARDRADTGERAESLLEPVARGRQRVRKHRDERLSAFRLGVEPSVSNIPPVVPPTTRPIRGCPAARSAMRIASSAATTAMALVRDQAAATSGGPPGSNTPSTSPALRPR